MSIPVTLDEFATYLNDPAVVTDATGRALLILDLAQTLCETIVNPLPATADIVVLDVAQRAYANPTSVGNNSLALYSEDQGPFNDAVAGRSGGGLWLTDNNKQTLRQLAGTGPSGAYTVDMTPATAAQNLPWWDTGSTWPEGVL